MLQLLTFTTLVQRFATSAQASAAAMLDFTVGSVLRALAEANASIALWMQWLILLVLAKTRAATSNGVDLDTWMADFTLTRQPASFATGTVTLSRYTPTTSALVPVGATVKTADGSQTFQVIADATRATWNAGLNGYLIPAPSPSADVSVQALAAGSRGNVQAGVVSLLATGIPGVDTVNNAAAFGNGVDAETDAALRTRFALFINTRARATLAAVAYAISAVQQGLSWSIQENVETDGSDRPGKFVVTLDDGTGSPPASLLDAVSSSIETYRPVGSVFAVQACSLLAVNVVLTIDVEAPGVKALLQPQVQAALTTYINALSMGVSLPFYRIAGVAFATDPSIVNVRLITANGGTADVVPTAGQRCVAGAITVN